MRGDLLFYTPTNLVEKIIAWWTHGPFCHVAVDMGDGTKIEADLRGIVRVSFNEDTIPARWTPAPTENVEPGLVWLKQQLGNPYGGEDIINQVIRLMGFKFYLGEPKRYDCSDLAADYLVHSDLGWLLGPFRDRLHLVTPNDLARLLGVHL
jgi:hypothetical protein